MTRFRQTIIAAGIVGLAGILLLLLPLGLKLEERFGLSLLFELRGPRTPPDNVMVVSLDAYSSEQLGLPTNPIKWPRTHHAQLIELLKRAGAAVIAFDMIFIEQRDQAQDDAFAQAIQRAGNVVLCAALMKNSLPLEGEDGVRLGGLSIEQVVPPITPLAGAAAAVAPFPLPKIPVRVSQYWTFKPSAGDIPTLPVVTYQLFTSAAYDPLLRLLEQTLPAAEVTLPPAWDRIDTAAQRQQAIKRLRALFLKDSNLRSRLLQATRSSPEFEATMLSSLTTLINMYGRSESHYLDFYGPPATIKTVPYARLLKSLQTHQDSATAIDVRGKAVFIGMAAHLRPAQQDGFYTVFSQPNGLDLSGVEIAATAFSNLMQNRPVRPLPSLWEYAILLIWGLVIGVLCYRLHALPAAAALGLLAALHFFLARHLFNTNGIWVPLVIPAFQISVGFFAMVLWKYFHTDRKRRNIQKVFKYYLPDEVVDRLAEDQSHLKDGSRTVFGTCLFTDAQQYMSLSEGMDPKALSDYMNSYYEVLFGPVKRHGGIVSDVIGDAMMAIWATTGGNVGQRSQACTAALEIATAVNRFAKSDAGLSLATRIGLDAGQMQLGSIGAINHYEYRAVGEVVNLASRLEGLNKYLGTQILVSDRVLDQVEGFTARRLGRFVLAGKSKPLTVMELMAHAEQTTAGQLELIVAFEAGLKAFEQQQWPVAISKFKDTLKMAPGDGPATYFLALIEKYRVDPPAPDWAGIVRLERK